MRAVPILMVHSNVSVKLAFQGMGIYAQVFMERFQKENLFSGCTKSVMNSFNVFIILDIDECSDKSTHSCDSNSNCTNTNGSYQCKCHQGFAGNGHTCSGIQLTLSYACYYFTDIDECSEGSHTCDKNATCTNTDGSFKCQCEIGFSGDGHTCTDLHSTFLMTKRIFNLH